MMNKVPVRVVERTLNMRNRIQNEVELLMTCMLADEISTIQTKHSFRYVSILAHEDTLV